MWCKLKARLFGTYRIVRFGSGEHVVQRRQGWVDFYMWKNVEYCSTLETAMTALNQHAAEVRRKKNANKWVQVYYA